jgi:hypothetical protein
VDHALTNDAIIALRNDPWVSPFSRIGRGNEIASQFAMGRAPCSGSYRASSFDEIHLGFSPKSPS